VTTENAPVRHTEIAPEGLDAKAWESLRSWFFTHQRVFPWRQNRDPYAVWVSEVMLQQTRADVVIRYFERWMELFPTIQALAEADWEKVLKAWEGLGYYSRARRLYQGAQFVCQNFGGQLPGAADDLRRIPGLGPYTVAAIQAFAFQQRAAPVDGNVLRVRSRLLSSGDCIDLPRVQQQSRDWLLQALPPNSPYEVAEALIELGAVICKPKNPGCLSCPLRASCRAFALGTQSELPRKAPRKTIQRVTKQVLLLVSSRGVLLEKGCDENRAFGLLCNFPTFSSREDLFDFLQRLCPFHTAPLEIDSQKRLPELKQDLRDDLTSHRHFTEPAQGESGIDREFEHPHCVVQHLVHHSVSHSFVNTQCTLVPWVAHYRNQGPNPTVEPSTLQSHGPNRFWIPLHQLQSLSFPSGHRSLIKMLAPHE
jgi:A/G-specific adenine glycosylase